MLAAAGLQIEHRGSAVHGTDARVDRMLISGDQAAAELWKAENGKLAALTIFFDTLSFAKFTET